MADQIQRIRTGKVTKLGPVVHWHGITVNCCREGRCKPPPDGVWLNPEDEERRRLTEDRLYGVGARIFYADEEPRDA